MGSVRKFLVYVFGVVLVSIITLATFSFGVGLGAEVAARLGEEPETVQLISSISGLVFTVIGIVFSYIIIKSIKIVKMCVVCVVVLMLLWLIASHSSNL